MIDRTMISQLNQVNLEAPSNVGIRQEVKLLLNEFNAMDTDKDGLVPIQLLVSMLKQYESDYTHETIRPILDKYGLAHNTLFRFQDLLTIINDLETLKKQ